MVEECAGFVAGGRGVALGERYELFGDALRFFGFGVRRVYAFVLEERGYEVAEEGFAVRGVARQVAVAKGAACAHGFVGRVVWIWEG